MKTMITKKQEICDYIADHPNCTSTEVAKALSKKGISVDPSYVRAVRPQRKSKPSKDSIESGQYQLVHKGQEICNYLMKHPDCNNQQVIDALAKDGVQVSLSYVTLMRTAYRNKLTPSLKLVPKGVQNQEQTQVANLKIEQVQAAKDFVVTCGGEFRVAKLLLEWLETAQI